MVKTLKELFGTDKEAGYNIYCDMDGVLTDFDSRFEHYTGMLPKEYVDRYGELSFWNIITDAGEVFWSKMEWIKGGKELWHYIKKYSPVILSSPSRESSSRTGKKKWVSTHLGTNVKLILAYSEEKQKYATESSILIDDRKVNLEQWKAAGGIAIECRHSNVKEVISKLRKLGYE